MRRVMTRRPHGAERALCFAVDRGVHSRAHRAGRAQRRLHRIRRHRRIRIDTHVAFLRHVVEQQIDQFFVVHTRELLACCAWSFHAIERGEAVRIQRGQDRL